MIKIERSKYNSWLNLNACMIQCTHAEKKPNCVCSPLQKFRICVQVNMQNTRVPILLWIFHDLIMFKTWFVHAFCFFIFACFPRGQIDQQREHKKSMKIFEFFMHLYIQWLLDHLSFLFFFLSLSSSISVYRRKTTESLLFYYVMKINNIISAAFSMIVQKRCCTRSIAVIRCVYISVCECLCLCALSRKKILSGTLSGALHFILILGELLRTSYVSMSNYTWNSMLYFFFVVF